MTTYGDVLWTPEKSRIDSSHMAQFATWVGKRVGKSFPDYPSLHQWSVTELEAFWECVAIYTKVKFQKPWSVPYVPPVKGRMLGAKWFPDSRLNFAENILEGGDGESRNPQDVAIIACAEGADRRVFTWRALKKEVAQCASTLASLGVGPGDRVAGVVANSAEAIIAMLGAASLGAIWSSCSPDFGPSAVGDRLAQVEPKVLFYTQAYHYGGKLFETSNAIFEVSRRLPTCRSVIVIPHADGILRDLPRDLTCQVWLWSEFLQKSADVSTLTYEPRQFDDPLYIMFSSGTTGVPKCMVHGVGGTLLQHKKELILHCDITPEDRLFYYTTCGWMMWNWMVSALSVGTSLLVYDGAVASPDACALWRLIRDESVTVFGTSPKYLSYCMTQNVHPKGIFEANPSSEPVGSATKLPLKSILVTGSPLLPEHAAWIYQELGSSVHLASISGGTDIISCFMLGHPGLPVRAGEIQCAGLGMAIEAWDDAGQPLIETKGELVCTKPFPSMPIGFWHDADGSRYENAYFGHFRSLDREVWRHGDFVLITSQGGVVVYGRSDATLNPGGVRIGTAELYRAVEAVDEVLDSVAVGRREADDTSIILFVKLRSGIVLDKPLADRIRKAIRSTLTPRHVPRAIIQVPDIPYTRSGKKIELAVTQAIHGEPVSNLSALTNPEAMNVFFAFGRIWPQEF